MLTNKVALFAIIALLTIVTLLIQHTPEVEKHTRKKHYATTTTLLPENIHNVFGAMLRKRSYFVKKLFVPATACLYYKSVIAVAEISVVETRSLYPGKQKNKKKKK